MPMAPFFGRFRDLTFREMRSATVRGQPDLPDGEYGFLELYCDEVNCDCRRVLIQVVSPTTRSVWATLNYGWESQAFYERWFHDRELARHAQGVTIEPFGEQTAYAPALRRLFEFVLGDPAYVERLKRHYAMFKQAIRTSQPAGRPHPAPGQRRRRRPKR